jgi:hypothetical protein
MTKLQLAGQIRSVLPIKLFKHTTINHQVAGLLPNQLGGEKEAPFCGCDNLTKINFFGGGGLAIAKSRPMGQIQPVHPVEIFKHTTINHQVAGLWLNWLRDGKAATFCWHGCSVPRGVAITLQLKKLGNLITT